MFWYILSFLSTSALSSTSTTYQVTNPSGLIYSELSANTEYNFALTASIDWVESAQTVLPNTIITLL